MFQKHTEILMKHYKDIYENVSSLVKEKQKKSIFNYSETYRKLSLYENKISFLNAKLDLLKKENTLLHEQQRINKVNPSNNKEVVLIKEDTKELKRAISIIKGEVHDIKKHLHGEPSIIQGLIHIEKDTQK